MALNTGQCPHSLWPCLPPVWMPQVMGTSLTAAQAVAKATLSLGEETKAQSLWAQAPPVGWQGAGGGSKAITCTHQWKASSIGGGQFCYRFQQSWNFGTGSTAQRSTLPSYMISVALGYGCPTLVWSRDWGTGDSRQSTEPW